MGTGVQQQSLTTKDPYGGVAGHAANRAYYSQISPLLQGFGFNNNKDFTNKLDQANGPLADLIRQTRTELPQSYAQSQEIGNQIGSFGPQLWSTMQQQMDQTMQDLPNFSAAANQGLDFAKQYAQDAFNPIADQALFGRTAENILGQARQGQAARGIDQSGGAQQGEQDILQQLGLQFAGNQDARQQAAIGQLGSATQNAQQVAGGNYSLLGQGRQGINEIAQTMQSQYGIPQQALANALQLLTAGQGPSIQLSQAAAPTVGSSSKGWKGGYGS